MAKQRVKVKMLVRSDTSEAWESKNPILDIGEIGYDITNKLTKIGDGKTSWVDLEWLKTETKPIEPNFATNTWEQINQFAQEGKASEVYAVGDEKVIELSTGEQITLVILGFNHDNLSSGGKASITIGMKNVLSTSYPMNDSLSNIGGWSSSQMRNLTMPTLFSLLPKDLQNIIKSVDKKCTPNITSADKLWLLSISEIYSQTALTNAYKYTFEHYIAEGEQYEYWEKVIGDQNPNEINAALYKCLEDGTRVAWWTRTPHFQGTVAYTLMSSFFYDANANSAYGVSFGFCI